MDEMNVASFKKLLEEIGDNQFSTILVHPSIMNSYWQMTKWEWFLEGFSNIKYALDCYETVEHFPDDFWESLSFGFMQMEIFPYDDCYNPKLSKQRKLLYGIREQPSKVQLIIQNKDFVAYTDGGYTICAQPDREKANSCLEYYKSQHPDAIVYGSWD